jgi:ubiquinone/menaquinone biosynthesis C-methylase UbiE
LAEENQKTMRKRELIGLYDMTAAKYNKRYREIQSEKYRYVVGLFEKRDVMLDVGCGTGLLLSLIGDKVGRIVGVDISKEMLHVASRDLKRRVTKGDLIRADADSLPFRNSIFTKVTSVSLLQNMSDPQATISEIARVAGAGGAIALTCLKKKYGLSDLRRMVASGTPSLKVVSEWDGNEEDIGINATKLI